jgi:hypothetical protein
METPTLETTETTSPTPELITIGNLTLRVVPFIEPATEEEKIYDWETEQEEELDQYLTALALLARSYRVTPEGEQSNLQFIVNAIKDIELDQESIDDILGDGELSVLKSFKTTLK